MSVKTCPHCGGGASLNCNYSRKTRSYFVYVRCDICGAQGKTYRSMEDPQAVRWDNMACKDAVKAWNMRTGEGGQHEEDAGNY